MWPKVRFPYPPVSQTWSVTAQVVSEATSICYLFDYILFIFLFNYILVTQLLKLNGSFLQIY